ncbi:UNVERIFIED_CONTAM: hypothetical protein Sradi_1888900 [Sesamum radiatum]|uniref:CCHC-type domain-containing protein n=1 Tax=Sesamum radiatum TaxID=300843 RepID=A0AAW2TYZ8_SESRA
MLNPVKGLEMRRLEEGRFLIRFNHVINQNRALAGCPWSFEKNTLILNEVGAEENPLHVDLDWCEFHIQVHDLPLSKMNYWVASIIGNSLGMFCDMEMDDFGKAWGASIQIRVAINVTQPLIRALRVSTTGGGGGRDELVVSFTYEWLLNFCYLCGRLGHIYASCDLRIDEGFKDHGEETPYGAWLHVPPGSWGSRKPWKALDSPSVRRPANSSTARGPQVFGRFESVHGPATSSGVKGKGVVHEGVGEDLCKTGDKLVEGVQSASSDGLGSHVPETGFPLENDIPMGVADITNFDPGMEDGWLVPSFCPPDPVLMVRQGRSRCRLPRRGSVVRKRGRDPVGVDKGEGSLRLAKRRHLLDEESDVLSMEVVMQPRHLP